MARHIDAWMDGVKLADVGAVVIREVTEPAPDMEITYTQRAFRGGQTVQKRRRKSLRVTIHAAVHELFDLVRRNEIRQAVAAWCDGGILELSNHPGQRLHVVCKGEPGLGDVRDFNAQLDIELEANAIPYWEDTMPSVFSGTGASGSGQLYIGGTAKEIPVIVTFTPTGTISTLTVAVSGGGVARTIELAGMSVTGPIVFDRDEEDRLLIRSGTTSLMRYRTAASADDLIVPHGMMTVAWAAGTGGSVSFSARGRWL